MGIEMIGNERLGAITSTILIFAYSEYALPLRGLLKYNSQKDIVPTVNRASARAMKRGPAAPVTLSPHLSRVLKHLNTHFEQIIVANRILSFQNASRGQRCCALTINVIY